MNVPPLNVPPQVGLLLERSVASCLTSFLAKALPPWLQGALTDMRRRYPNDALDIVAYPQLNPSTGGVVTVFRLVCGDCPGKVRTHHVCLGQYLKDLIAAIHPWPG